MDYALAKELDDRGFKFRGETSLVLVPTGNVSKDNPILPYPTLEELIEACGELVLTVNEEYSTAETVRGQTHFSESGSTPIEAVARLYLALNKK
jgi:hypothetical protein